MSAENNNAASAPRGVRRPVQVEATEQDKNDALFFDAVMKGNMKQAQWFLDKGADPRKPSGAHTPLRAASLQGYIHIVKWLVDELHITPKEDDRVLCVVALGQKPSEELFSYLVERGADPKHADEKLGTPLMLALQQGHEDFVHWMVGKYDLPCNEQAMDTIEKSSPLHKACAGSSAKMVDWLIESRGASACFNVTDCQGYTPLMIAVREKKPDVVELLLKKYGVDPNVMTDTSALFISSEEGYLPTTRALLENKADPNVWHPKMGISPLHLAASNDHTFVAQELIKHKANLDVQSSKGYTPLIMACSQGYLDVTKILIDAGCNCNYQAPGDGATALHHAVCDGFIPCTKLLLASGKFDLSLRDKGNMTAAECAVAMQQEAKEQGKSVKSFEILSNMFSTLESDDKGKCAACFKALEQPKRCGRCKSLWYCSAVCQKAHWPMHKSSCKEVKEEEKKA